MLLFQNAFISECQYNNTMNTKTNRQKTIIALVVSIIIPLIIIIVPLEYIPIHDITVTQQRVLAIFVMVALMWVLEPIQNFTTSLVAIIALLLLASTSAPKFLIDENYGIFINYKTIFSSFSAPIIMLFMGGFSLAIAIQKYHIDFTLAKVLLRPFGKKPKNILFGLMFITAMFSMFMSNTATTAMMISILLPVLKALPSGDKIKGAFALGIPFAANIGGIGTPIGTPPNAIALGFLPDEYQISFASWMGFAVPFMLVLLLLTWVILCLVNKTTTEHLEIAIPPQENISRKKQIIIYVTFAITILLWMTDTFHGIKSYVVALLPMVIFFIAGILEKEDLSKFNWDVLWLVSGGIAIGSAMDKTGLAENLVNTFNLSEATFLTILVSAMFISYLLSNFMSHTAASNLIFPIIIAIVIGNETIVADGLVLLIILCTVFASSLSMILPISTPPNALGYSTGAVSTKEMAIMGITIGVIGLVLAYFYFTFLTSMGVFSNYPNYKNELFNRLLQQ